MEANDLAEASTQCLVKKSLLGVATRSPNQKGNIHKMIYEAKHDIQKAVHNLSTMTKPNKNFHILIEEKAYLDVFPDIPTYAKIKLQYQQNPVTLTFSYADAGDLTTLLSLVYVNPNPKNCKIKRKMPTKIVIYSENGGV